MSDMPSSTDTQYATDRNLRARSNIVARYSGRGWFGWVHEILDLTPGSSVLDVGCGMGWFWRGAKTPLDRLVLADSSPALLGQARDNLSSVKFISNVDAIECDAVALPLQDRTFDAALALHMLYHVADQEAAVRELARVVRPTGMVAVTTNSLDNSKALMGLAQEAFGGTGRDPGAELFSPEMGNDLLSRHFAHVEMHEFVDQLTITDASDIFAALVSMPPGNEASEDERKKLEELLENLAISEENPFIDNRSSFLLIAKNGD